MPAVLPRPAVHARRMRSNDWTRRTVLRLAGVPGVSQANYKKERPVRGTWPVPRSDTKRAIPSSTLHVLGGLRGMGPPLAGKLRSIHHCAARRYFLVFASRTLGVGPSHLHKKCHTIIKLLPGLGRLAPGDSALRARRNGSYVRRERWARRNFRAGARGGSGCRRSSAHFGPVPLPPKVSAVKMLTFIPEAAVHRLRW